MSIEEICKKYGIKNYVINSDESIDVYGNVNLSNKGLTKIPLTFNKVTGDFDCKNNYITSLKGCPKKVEYLDCSDNKLTSLEYSPEYVDGSFYCSSNNLTSLKGISLYIGGSFGFNDNNITNLYGLTSDIDIGGGFFCNMNPISSIIGNYDDYNKDFVIAFNTFKVIKDGVVNLKRLIYVMEMFDKPVNLDDIKKEYTIK